MSNYCFQYLPRSEQAFDDYLKELGVSLTAVLPRGLHCQMKEHWYVYQYIGETDQHVCLGWDAYPNSYYCVDDLHFYIFWIPKLVFQNDWCRSLRTVNEALGYFSDEGGNRGDQLCLFS